jgi:hypothetical protein
MPHTVFIHTNHKQMVGALVAQHALRRNSKNADKFDIRIIHTADHDFLRDRDGQHYLRDGARRLWLYEDLQSFTPLRFMPPELMGYQGRAVVIDPDVFAQGDVWELLTRDMGDKAILCRRRSGSKGRRGCLASSVMVLDCAKLTDWHCETQFNEMFALKRDYMEWISLKLEPEGSIGLFEHAWNDFDHLTPQTKLLHNTKRKTQPWKTGLKVDYFAPEKPGGSAAIGWLYRTRRRVFGNYAFMGRFLPHPDPNQERFFFGLLRECLENGIVTEDMIKAEMRDNHVRHDAFSVLDRTPPLAA